MKNNDFRGGDERRPRYNGYKPADRKPYGGRDDEHKPYGRRDDDERRSFGRNDGERKPYGDHKPYGRTEDHGRGDPKKAREGGFRGAGRRVYDGEGNPPRVGRIEPNVPKAVRVTGDRPVRKPDRADIVERDFKPRSAFRQEPSYDFEPPEIPEDLAAEFENVSVEDENLLVGRNPIREALKANRPMEKLLVSNGDLSGAAREIIKLAKEAGVVVQYVDRMRLDQIYPAHQGMLAYVAAVPYVSVEEILDRAAQAGEDPFLIMLDGITDPHNLGAIIRSAECAGAHGVIVPERRSAGLSPTAAKAAAGALNHMPIAKVSNLNRTIDELKAKNIWVIGTAMKGENAFTADLTGPVALVIGSEGDGISRLTLEKCDRCLTLPMKGHIESLNASVAAGILMYQIARARL